MTRPSSAQTQTSAPVGSTSLRDLETIGNNVAGQSEGVVAADSKGEVTHRFLQAFEARPIFIVGCPRSGTTLTRLILDSNTALAIPLESHFLVGLRPKRLSRYRSIESHIQRVSNHFSVQSWDVDLEEVERLVRLAEPHDFPSVARAFFSAYAALKGKTRWGDKTPGYVSYLPHIASLFPDLQVVHVIRDGRAAASSMAEQRWGPPTAVSGARRWRQRVSQGRSFGSAATPGQYTEVRHEEMTAKPKEVVAELCMNLGLTFEPAMLDFHQMASTRVALDGTSIHRHLAKPVTAGLRQWDSGLSARQRMQVVAACGHPLRELGYVPALPSRRYAIEAFVVWFRDALRSSGRVAKGRLRPGVRWY